MSIDGGVGIVCYTKGIGGQDSATKKGARVLDIPEDLAASGQTDITPASGEGQNNRGKTGTDIVPPSPPG